MGRGRQKRKSITVPYLCQTAGKNKLARPGGVRGGRGHHRLVEKKNTRVSGGGQKNRRSCPDSCQMERLGKQRRQKRKRVNKQQKNGEKKKKIWGLLRHTIGSPGGGRKARAGLPSETNEKGDSKGHGSSNHWDSEAGKNVRDARGFDGRINGEGHGGKLVRLCTSPRHPWGRSRRVD